MANNKPSRRQNLKCWIKTAIFVLYFIKFLTFIFYQNKLFYEILGDHLHLLFTKFTFIYAIFVCILTLAIIAKLFVTYCESKPDSGLHCVIGLMRGLKSCHRNYRLKAHNKKKLNIGSNILFWLYIKIIGDSVSSFIMVLHLFISIVIYIKHTNKFNIIIVLVDTCCYLILYKHVISLVLSGAFIFYLPITFLNCKYNELIDTLHLAIRLKNKKILAIIIQNYDQLTRYDDKFISF